MPPFASTGTTAELATTSPGKALRFDATGRALRPAQAVRNPEVLGATYAKLTSTALVTAGFDVHRHVARGIGSYTLVAGGRQPGVEQPGAGRNRDK